MGLPIESVDFTVPSEVPVLTARHQVWSPDAAAELARRMRVDAQPADSGLWLIARDRRAALEIYLASASFRFSRLDLDEEGRDGVRHVPSDDDARRVADAWIPEFGPQQVLTETHSITPHEVLMSDREDSEPRSLVVGMDVNYRFSFEGIPFLGPGAKAKVSLHHSLDMSGAYVFWRDYDVTGSTPILPAEAMLERFSASPLCANLDRETSRARIDSARLGWLCLPPTETMGVLVPALELRGTISTQARPTYDFVTYVGATDSDETTAKNAGHINPRPALLVA